MSISQSNKMLSNRLCHDIVHQTILWQERPNSLIENVFLPIIPSLKTLPKGLLKFPSSLGTETGKRLSKIVATLKPQRITRFLFLKCLKLETAVERSSVAFSHSNNEKIFCLLKHPMASPSVDMELPNQLFFLVYLNTSLNQPLIYLNFITNKYRGGLHLPTPFASEVPVNTCP